MKVLIHRLGPNRLRQWLPLATLVILVALVGIAQPVFLEPASLLQLASDTAVLFILATGVTFVIMLGGIDLSIQSMASLASVIVALTIARLGYGAFVLAVAIGAIAGLLSGLVHVRLKIPSFIATLAMGGVLYSSALVISKERSITLEDAERGYQTWITGKVFDVPNVIVVGLIVLIVAHVLQSRTRFGRYSAAIGAGEPAAYASGVKVNRQKVFAFVLSASLAALAGVILAGRLASGSPTLAAELLLPSIAAVVVGGTAITGGVGSIWRTLVGALIISVVRIGMTFLGVNIFAQNIVFGAVLVAAVAITIDRSKIPIVK
jgi:ribose transport system permease protein